MNYGTTEQKLISEILDSPVADAPRTRYAEWLRSTGDNLRAALICASRLNSLDCDLLEAKLPELTSEHFGWSRLLGLKLIHQVLTLGLEPHLEQWLSLAKPAIELTVGGATGDEEPTLGSSRLWGDPDLPKGTPWPTLADCRRWEPQIDLPKDSPCQFIAQINLAELAASPAARDLPRAGLLSVFSHHEWEETGSSSICLRYFEDTSRLQRTLHALSDADNARIAPHVVQLREALTIPECHSSPFAHEMGIEAGDWDTVDKHHEVLLASGGELLGLLGHDRSTSGDDPTPDQSWGRLITIPVFPDGEVVQHLAIRQEALMTAELEDHELVWVDFDGA